MASSSSSSSSFSNCWKYDVFLNFRGEDTRKIFVGHLYKALDQKAISTFMDAEELRKGNDISELLMCIQESRLSIVVLSQNYAASTWCLKELVKILECLDTRQQIVVPIFYQVDPSHVRKLQTSFAQGFAQYEHDHHSRNEDVQTWKSAITRVANLSGWDSRHYKDDAKLIDDIVEDVFNKLIHISSSNVNSLVGMGSHLSEMDLLLCPDKVNDVRVIGIWGMGGLGKTTIARAVYDKIACNFEHYCFLENVNEGFLKKGKAQMQEELESRIFKAKVQSLGILNRCSNMIINRLGKKKVFLVLDDVDSCAQIETLIGKHSFGGGSRIIITTRDIQSLSGVDATYSPSFLSGNEALKLFRQHAFRTNQPSGEYDHLLQRAIDYAQGLPLALKVLGAFLDNKSVREWEDVLEKIKKIPHRGIQDVLITSFDGLDDLEKDIFLDIACFFKGISKGYVTKILDGCGFFCHSGLRVLVDRALVTISDWNMLEMHDLLQEMGREIVRQESAKEPGRRSRLWSYEDAKKVLTQNTATEEVEGIFLDLSKSKEVYLHTEGFVRMTKLRLLKIYNSGDDPSDDCKQHVSGDLKFLSPELRLLLWHGFPLKSLPSNFQPKNLVDIDMRYSLIEQLWEGTKPLTKLNFINLSHSQYLTRIPDFSEAPNLERLNFEGCICLSEIHPSISALRKLVFLSLKGCKELKSLSSSSIGMKSLKTFNLSGCSSLEKFPKISAVMKELSELCLDDTEIKQLPSSINNLTGLVTLNLRGCKELKILPSRIYMKSLKHLYLEGCSNLEKFPEISEVMKELSQLYLDETAIKELPSSIEQLEGLEILSLRNCRSLLSLPDTICNLENLTELYLAGCSELCNLPKNLGNLEFLRDLEIEGSGVRQLPLSMLRLKFETLSSASWPSSIPEYSSFSALLRLNLNDCNLLELSDGIAHLSSLQTLELSRNNFESLPATMNELGLLTRLNLEACKRLKSIPELSSSIKHIDAHDCTALETVSKPKPQHHTHHCFTFSNCLQLVQTNLFNDIVETHCLCQDNCLQVLSFKMSLPGNEIPDWFNHQCSGSSVTVQLPPDWLCNQFFGFAICANFKGANIHASHHLSARCFCTLKGNHGETAFSFDLLRWRFKNDRFLESDHLFQGYVSWSKYRLVEQGKPVNERYYTEATFEIVVDNEIYAPEFSTVIQHHRITSCGVRFFTRPKCDHDRCEILLATMKKRKRERKIERGQRRSRRGV